MNLYDQSSFRDWHKSVYQIEHEQRLDAGVKRRQAIFGIVFWLVLAACIIGYPWI